MGLVKDYLDEKARLIQTNRFMRFVITILSIGFILNALICYVAFNSEKVVIIPPDFTEGIYVKGGTASEEYIKAMVKYVCYLAFTYTPQTVHDQFNDLLKLVASESYNAYRTKLYSIAEDAVTANISSLFTVTSIRHNPVSKKILVTGDLKQWTSHTEKPIIDERKNYILVYRIHRGRFMIVSLNECEENCTI